MASIPQVLGSARILHRVFLATIAFFVVVLVRVPPVGRTVPSAIVIAMGFACVTDIAIAVFLRARMVQASEERLREDPQDSAALNRWRAGTLLSFVFAESVVLFGFALKVIGVGWNIAAVFFAVGVTLLLLWAPRLDLPSAS